MRTKSEGAENRTLPIIWHLAIFFEIACRYPLDCCLIAVGNVTLGGTHRLLSIALMMSQSSVWRICSIITSHGALWTPVVKGILKEDDDGNLIEKRDKFHFKWVIIPPFNEVKRGYTGFTLSVCGQNRVRSVSSTILVGFISYLHILSSNFRRYVACKVCFKIQKFFKICNFDFVFFWLGIQFDPII